MTRFSQAPLSFSLSLLLFLGLLLPFTAALTAGSGTFKTDSGKWIYYNAPDDSLYLGSAAGTTPPASIFKISSSSTKNLWKVFAQDNSKYVGSGGTKTIPLRAITKNPGTFNFFNMTQSSNGYFTLGSWNGAYSKTLYFGIDSKNRLTTQFGNDKVKSGLRFKFVKEEKTDGDVTYRTFTSATKGTNYNVSTFLSSSDNMYGYSVKWIGNAFDSNRPMILYLGGSDSRSNHMDEATDVLDKTQSTGFPKLVNTNGTLADYLLSRALLVVPSSPTCYNTSLHSYLDQSCGVEKDNHFLKHYRPWLLKKIYDDVSKTFGFDDTRFYIAGTGMGARGALRFGIHYPELPAAISLSSGALETSNSTYIKSTPYIQWNSGEGCWNPEQPNIPDHCSEGDAVPPTMNLGNTLKGFPIRIWSSRYDDIDTLAEAQQTCDNVNSEQATKYCEVIDTKAPTHQSLAYYGRDSDSVDFLTSYRRLAGQDSQRQGGVIFNKRHKKKHLKKSRKE